MSNDNLDFTAMENSVGPVKFKKTMGPYRSQFSPGQEWVQGDVTVNELTYNLVLAVDAETGLVLSASDGVAPGMYYTVAFADAELYHGCKPNKSVDELFSNEYHHRYHGEGRDKRSATERFGRLD